MLKEKKGGQIGGVDDMNVWVLKCDSCGALENSINLKKETIPVRGENIEIESRVRICKCGNELFDEVLDSENLNKAYEEYRKRHHILKPDDIKNIREKYGLSQRTLGKVLGWGEITIHRYESGAIPDPSHHKILRLLDDPQIVKTLVAEARELIPKATYQRIMDKINAAIEEKNADDFFNMFEARFQHEQINIESGYKQFDLKKFCHVILFFAQNVKQLWLTKLNKLLFYSDFTYFKEFTSSLTGVRYLKFEYGPVPQEYEALLWGLEDAGYIRRIPEVAGQFTGMVVEALSEFDRDLFTQKELEVMESILTKYGETTASYIRDKSHEEQGWIKTGMYEVIPYSYANNLLN